MSKSIKNRLAEVPDPRTVENMRPLFEAIYNDLTALRTQLAQLITDYNANATISTDTTAVAPTLELKS